jgi:4-amino-4-deoxy-L-arabinose transferase-like glycosyltransferase
VSKHEFRALLAVAVAAVAIRLAVSASFKGHSYVAAEPVKPETEATYLKRGEIGLGDSEQYLLLGAGIRHRLSYSWNDEPRCEGESGNGEGRTGIPNTFRTPGYPLLLALLNDNVTAIVLVQALLAGLTVFLAGLVGHRLFNSRVGLLGASLLAVDIPSIFSSGMVMSEVLFTFSVVLAAALVWGWPRGEGERGNGEVRTGTPSRSLSAAAAGLVLGFAVLVRPAALLAFVPFGVALVARRNWRGLVMMLAAFSLLPGIWVARNYYHYRRFSLTSNGGYNLLYANAAAVKGDEQHVTWDSARIELARDFTARLATDNPLELADLMTRKATSIILHDPLRYAWICLRGVPKVIAGIKSDDLVLRTLAAIVPGTQGSVLLNPGYGSPGVRLAIWLLAGFELLTAIGGFLLALVSLGFRRWRAEKLMLVAIGLYFVAVALPFTDGRFRVPAMPFLYLVAATVLAGRTMRGAAQKPT